MIKKLFAPFAALGTWFRNKLRTDPFFGARLKILALYMAMGAVMSVGKGVVSDYSLHTNLTSAVLSGGDITIDDAFAIAVKYLWVERFVFLVLFGVAVYLVTDIVLRPIKKSAELQKRFVSIVSHELRTPLAVMKNSTEVALRKKAELPKERLESVLMSNLEEIDHMTDTLRFLIAFALLNEQKTTLSFQKVSLATVAKESIELLKARYPDHGVAVSLAGEIEGVIEGDEAALKSLFFNVLENSLLHTKAGGRVAVSIMEEKRTVQVTVVDTGTGIAPADLPYIFEPFYRGNAPELFPEQSTSHMGLGLSLVREVAQLHHAHLKVSSELGKGTTVTVAFPR